MDGLWLYRVLSRLGLANYRLKIIVVAFIGTHVPLIAIVADVAWRSTTDWASFARELIVALTATLVGTGVTLLVLSHLLRPVLMTSRTLRIYRETRQIALLPSGYTDEVGTLMNDANETLRHLETARVRLEHFDEATGLANREKLRLAIEDRIAAGYPFAVCTVAMNSYARVATTVDAATAESALRQIARRLQDFLGAQIELARIAPDRFGFLSGDPNDAADAWSGTAEELRDLVMHCGAQLRLESMTAQPHLTGGIATFPADGTTAEALMDCGAAAAALLGARTSVAFYSREVRDEALDRFKIEEDLRTAIREDQFELHYQPVVDVSEGRAVGSEALIRWNHPQRGLIPPGKFIPVAESSGLIADIGLWVINAACAQAARWNASGLGGLKVAVNISARQFHDPALVSHVREALEQHRIQPGQLEIELTESALMDDFARSRVVFGKLRDLGVGIAIDDFGTGFASLSYLRRLPFDKLKLDREFVMNVHQTPESQAICGALISLAQGLGLKVLAEGTEVEDEIRYLHDRGCTLFQGFYLSKPVKSDDFAKVISAPRFAAVSADVTRAERRSA